MRNLRCVARIGDRRGRRWSDVASVAPDKRAALLGAFFARFALGFFAANVRLPVSPVASGLVVGILTSVPDAIITKAYAPILVTGIVFGAIAGWVVGRWAPPL